MEFLFWVMVGLCPFVILLVSTLSKKTKPSGMFIIDFSDPTKDVCRLELHEELESIYFKKHIILKIKKIEVSQQ